MTTFTIANGASLSDAKQLSGALPVGIVMPATWTPANLSLQISIDGATYKDVYLEDDTEYVVKAAASRFILFMNVSQMFALGPQTSLKIRSGTSGTPVSQGGDRVIELVVLP